MAIPTNIPVYGNVMLADAWFMSGTPTDAEILAYYRGQGRHAPLEGSISLARYPMDQVPVAGVVYDASAAGRHLSVLNSPTLVGAPITTKNPVVS